jgi:hypothetical protein
MAVTQARQRLRELVLVHVSTGRTHYEQWNCFRGPRFRWELKGVIAIQADDFNFVWHRPLHVTVKLFL